jgi:hypothetical protein
MILHRKKSRRPALPRGRGDIGISNKNITISGTLHEINKEALELLYRELGISKTIRFLNQYSAGMGDYTRQKEIIYQGKTVQDLVSEIQKENMM